MSFSSFVPIQSPHSGSPEIMKLEDILSKNGDQWSRQEMEFVFIEFFVNRNFIKVVKRKIIRVGISESDREEVEQGFYVHILTQMVDFDLTHLEKDIEPINKFTAFVRMLLNYWCWNYFRRRNREREIISPDQPVNDDSDQTWIDLRESDAVSQEDEAIQNEQRHIVNECVQKLPALQKRTLLLRYVEDLSYEEMAAIEGVSENTIRKRIFDAIRNIHRCLKKDGRL